MTDDGVLPQIERELHIAASPATVFQHFVDPERVCRWLGHDAELDPRPGGLFRVTVTDGVVARGSYVVVEPDRKVVFTWGWEGNWIPVPPGTTTVEVVLEPSNGHTIMRLVHRGLPVEQVDFHAWGWRQYLPRLEATSAGHAPGPDPLASFATPVEPEG